ncbi:hypothetical protein M569_10706 [Genlisea aurea]|uniref:Bifunctional inhibitor/plant lipid transfer protein/seed storage helical domain-containing protein n=1 Tax=Genlisea aurea TaxID=192259 RepID=S8CAW8_9LAMI|nr:hypothetical protein M569_10706 [Genlisea aurea]
MAQKLALTALSLMALLAIAAANARTTTTITTTVDEEANQGRQERCRQEVQGRQFHNCARYLSRGGRGGGYFGGRDEDDNQGGRMREGEHLQRCCEELNRVERECQCEAIRHAAQRAQQEQGSQGREWREQGRGQSESIYERAQDLPQRCGLSQEQCRFRVVFV